MTPASTAKASRSVEVCLLEREPAMDSFKCFSCGREYRWLPEIAGRTLRCKCGEKVRCPEPEDDTITAGQSLDDTVGDVELGEHLDQVDAVAADTPDEAGSTDYRRIPQKGIFGWPIGQEVLFWSILSLVGVGLGILAAIMREYYIPYSVAFVVIAPYSWLRLYKVWPRWTQGRPWFECLAEALGGGDDTQRPTSD